MQAIIMAGGRGRRLMPYTTILPKPLMPIGDIPILEVIIRQLKHYGVTDIILCVGYLAELLKSYFGNGEKWNISIKYSYETKNLGTIGPLTLIEDLEDNFFVMNGDILCSINFSDLMKTHLNNNSLATVSAYVKNVFIDLGILEKNSDNYLTNYIEKPTLKYNVSMGIYVMNKKVVDFMKYNEYFDIPQLMFKLMNEKKNPYLYSFEGSWLDIGRKEDYEFAIDEFEKNKQLYLPSE